MARRPFSPPYIPYNNLGCRARQGQEGQDKQEKEEGEEGPEEGQEEEGQGLDPGPDHGVPVRGVGHERYHQDLSSGKSGLLGLVPYILSWLISQGLWST